MRGLVVGLVDLKLGENTYTQNLYVAPVEDHMLLGIDIFLKKTWHEYQSEGILWMHKWVCQIQKLSLSTNGSVKYKN